MNRIVIFGAAAALLASLPAPGAALRASAGPPRSFGELTAQIQRAAALPAGPAKRTPRAIVFERGSYAILLPGAGNLPGDNGTYYRSDVTLANFLSSDQPVAVFWLAEGVDNTKSPAQFFTIPANTVVSYDDFVGQTLGKQGLGAVEIIGVDSSHNADLSAYFDATSRIWTPQPGGSGTTSLQLASVSLNPYDLVDNSPAYAFGLKQTAGFHTNVGIVNLDSSPHTWTVVVNGQTGNATFGVTVLPNSLQQVAIPGGDFGDLYLGLQPDSAGFSWSAYGVSDDNSTGDGWAAHAYQP